MSIKLFFAGFLLVVGIVSAYELDTTLNCNGDQTKFRCKGSPRCISKKFICDGKSDCGSNDPSDEDSNTCDENCGGVQKRFQCSNKKCILDSKTCNGQDDCGDNSDESTEICANCNGMTGRIKCRLSNKCFEEADKCDGIKDCNVMDPVKHTTTLDDTDEEKCSKRRIG